MAQVKIPYLVSKPGKGGLPRWFWQPAKVLRDLGWRAQRIPDDHASYADPRALEAAAIAKARRLNEELDAWRQGTAPATDAPTAAPASPAPVRQAPPPGSLAAVVTSYKASRFYLPRKPKSKRAYSQSIAVLEAWGQKGGVSVPARAITPKMVQDFYTKLHAKTPAVANNAVRMLHILMEHARRENIITINPAHRPGLISAPPSGLVWPREAVELFVRIADANGRHSIGTAVLINEWLGQREGDILGLQRRALRRAGDMMFIQGKTRAGVVLPIDMVKPLADRLEAELGRQDAALGNVVPVDQKARHLIVYEPTGAPYNEHTFRHEFARIRDLVAAEVPSFEVDYPVYDAAGGITFEVKTTDLVYMYLRHTAVVRLGEANCEPGLIRGVTGHTLSSVNTILERYMVRTGEMARQAFAKRLEKERAGT